MSNREWGGWRGEDTLPRADLFCFSTNAPISAALYAFNDFKGSGGRPLPGHDGEENMVRHGEEGVLEWAGKW